MRAANAASRNSRYLSVWKRNGAGAWSLLAFALVGAGYDGATVLPRDVVSASLLADRSSLTIAPHGAA